MMHPIDAISKREKTKKYSFGYILHNPDPSLITNAKTLY